MVSEGPGHPRTSSGTCISQLSTSVRWGGTSSYWAADLSLWKPLVGAKARCRRLIHCWAEVLPAGTWEAPITWKVPWAQGRQKRPCLSLVQHAGGAGLTLALLLTSCTYRFGWEGVRGWKHAPDLLVGVLMPSLVWISGHGCVVQGLKVHSFHADWPINASH